MIGRYVPARQIQLQHVQDIVLGVRKGLSWRKGLIKSLGLENSLEQRLGRGTCDCISIIYPSLKESL